MVGLSVGVGEGTVAVGVSVGVGGGSVLVGVSDGRGWKGVRVLAQVGWRVALAVAAAGGLTGGSPTVTTETAPGSEGNCRSKGTTQAVRITPRRPRSKARLILLFQFGNPLGISFYGSDTTMSM
jgi:hypothetical protein